MYNIKRVCKPHQRQGYGSIANTSYMYINATKIANILLEDCNYNRGVISQQTS